MDKKADTIVYHVIGAFTGEALYFYVPKAMDGNIRKMKACLNEQLQSHNPELEFRREHGELTIRRIKKRS